MTSESEKRLRRELEQTRSELQDARSLIALMERSRFWKAGRIWERIKRRVGPGPPARHEPMAAPVAAPGPLPARAQNLPTWWRNVPVRGAGIARTGATVDVVVFVEEPLTAARGCLESVVRATRPPFRLIVVDGTASSEARRRLEAFVDEQGAALAPDASRLGRILRSGSAEAVAIVSRSVIVGPDWIDRMLACLDAGCEHAVIPLFDGIAALPLAGSSDDDVCDVIAAESGRLYPEVKAFDSPVFVLRKSMLPATLPEGFGDLGARLGAAGPCVVADDVYVRSAMSDVPRGATLSGDRVLAGLTARNAGLPGLRALRARARSHWEGRRVLFVLPVMDRGGGGNVVFAEARALARMGIDARVLNLTRCREAFERNYGDCGVPVVYATEENVSREGANYDAVVATLSTSVPWIAPLADRTQGPVLAYYVQDFEPYFYPLGSPEHAAAWESYELVPALKIFAKTEWNCRELAVKRGVACTAIGPSYDAAVFRPRLPEPAAPPVRIAAMVRPSTPRRQPRFTLEVLREIANRLGDGVELITFGADDDDPQLADLPRDFPHAALGILDSTRLAALFNQVHVFADLSSYQAMGLVGMEAMACGTAVVLPQAGGAGSFATHERNALIVDTASRKACVAAIERLVRDADLRSALCRNGVVDIVEHVPERAAFHLLETLFGPV